MTMNMAHVGNLKYSLESVNAVWLGRLVLPLP